MVKLDSVASTGACGTEGRSGTWIWRRRDRSSPFHLLPDLDAQRQRSLTPQPMQAGEDVEFGGEVGVVGGHVVDHGMLESRVQRGASTTSV